MKRIWLAVFLSGMMVAAALPFGNRPRIVARWVIDAGDAWTVTLNSPGSDTGEQVPVVLFNGLQSLSTTLTLGTGGIAVWRIPEGEITQAGVSLLVVHYAGEAYRWTLRVRPAEPSTVDLFTTANTLPAYGEGSATIMILPRDQWGNAARTSAEFQLNIRYPDGSRSTMPFTYTGGLGWLTFQSRGNPGRVRFTLETATLSSSLEVVQTPGLPHTISLNISPDCVLDAGRDRVSLVATVTDSHDSPVVNGTLVYFDGAQGRAYGRTVDGRAILRLPAPSEPGWYTYGAVSDGAYSNPAFLYVSGETCPDDE